jgi:SAM-dependent methyltransferase
MSQPPSTGAADLPFSAASDRNKAPILTVLASVLPAQARVLEVASGTGQHAEHFAATQPGWQWQPTDYDADALPAVATRCARLANVRAPIRLDVLQQPWPAELDAPGSFDAAYCANMIHISPWATCAGLMQGAARLLVPAGVLVLYGPYLEDDVVTSPGNLAFDADLRRRNPAWGIRRLADVVAQAQAAGLTLERRVEMPANNLTLVFRQARPVGT